MSINHLSGDSGFSRAELVKLLNENNVDKETQNKILFNFDSCDASDSTGENDGVLKKDALKNFMQFMDKNHPFVMEFMNFKSGAMDNFKAFKDNAMQRFNDFKNNAMSGGKSVSEPTPDSRVEPPKTHETGEFYAEVNADGTTSEYNLKERTVTLYDKDGNKIRTTSMDAPKNEKSDTKNLTQQEIDEKITNLKPGESYTYTQTSETRTGIGFSKTTQTITWSRNEDGTLQAVTMDLLGMKPVKLKTIYSPDKTRKISEQKVNSELKLVATINYDENGKPINEVVNMSEYKKSPSMTVAGLLLRQMQKNANAYSSSEIKNTSGEVILSFRNGDWYNSKGKKIDADKAYDIIEKQNNKNNLGDFVRNY